MALRASAGPDSSGPDRSHGIRSGERCEEIREAGPPGLSKGDPSSDAQTFSALRPSCVDDLAAAACGHARAETMSTLSLQIARLESSLHLARLGDLKGSGIVRTRL